MKKQKFMQALALALLGTVCYGVQSMNDRVVLTDLALENVEALAQDEGTKAGYCYVNGGGNEFVHKVFCDSKTSNNMIYPCPAESWGRYLESAKDRCTK